MENALEVRGLTKHYRGFTLDGVSFSLPTGCIMGFIGENGAGKSTTIRLMLGLARAEAGSVRLLGEDPAAGGAALREKLGVVMDDCGIPETLLAAGHAAHTLGGLRTFDAGRFDALAARFELPERKLVKDYSRGNADEALAGLGAEPRLPAADPRRGDERAGPRGEGRDTRPLSGVHTGRGAQHLRVLAHIERPGEGLRLYNADPRRAHSVSEEKDALLEKYVVAKVSEAELRSLDPARWRACGARPSGGGAGGAQRGARAGVRPGGIEDIMLYYLRGERK